MLRSPAAVAQSRGGDYSFALASTAGVVAIVVVVLVLAGREWRGVDMSAARETEAPAVGHPA